MNEFRNLPEESEASQRAKQMGLVYKGFGRWADPKTGKVTHKTDNGQLVPVGQEKQHPGMTDPTKVAPGGKKRPNPGRPHPDLGPPPARDIPQRGDDETEDDYADRMASRASSQDRAEKGLDPDPDQDVTTPKSTKTDPKSSDDKDLEIPDEPEDSIEWVDSSSDGMQGWVELRDRETGDTEKVGWSVSGDVTSQSQAAKIAKKKLSEPKYDAPQEQPPKDLSLSRAYGIDAINPQDYIQKLEKHIDMPDTYKNALQRMAADIGNKGLARDKAVKALDKMASDDDIMSKYVRQEKQRQSDQPSPETSSELDRLKRVQQDIIKRGKEALARGDDAEAERLAQMGQRVVDQLKKSKSGSEEGSPKQSDDYRRVMISRARHALQQGDKEKAREIMKKLNPNQ